MTDRQGAGRAPLLLLLDAAAAPALVAIGDATGAARIWRAEDEASGPAAAPLAGLLRQALDSEPRLRSALTRVAAATGPGMFTGVRAATAMARAAALALGVQAVGVDAFSATAAHLARDLAKRGRWGLAFGTEARPVWRMIDLDQVAASTAGRPPTEAFGPLRQDALDLAVADGWAGPHPKVAAAAVCRRAPPESLLALAAAAPADAPRPAPFYGRGPDATPSRYRPPPRLGA